MRKWRILTLLLAVLAVIGLPAAALWISEYKKDVTYDETVLQGDAADFSGVSIQTQNQLRDRVFWETTYRPGTGEAPETRMRFGTVKWEYPDYTTFFVTTPLLSETYAAHEGAENPMVQDVASRAPADQQEHQEWVRAADYFEVFPLQFMFDEYYSSPIGTADEKQWRLYEAFQIPVPEDLMVVVSVYFYDHPTHDGRYTSSIDAAEGTVPSLDVCFAKQTGEDGGVYWFTLDCSLPGGGALDTSRIPGGTGVFRFDTAENTVETVYPFAPETKICDLWLSEDEETLYLLRSLDGVHTLTALSVPEMAERQVLTLPVASEAALTTPYHETGLLLAPASDGTLLVLTEDADGTYTLQMQLDTAGDPALEHQEFTEPWTYITADYRDDRLALVRLMYGDDDTTRDMDLVVSVYDETGSRSTMESRCSLGRENDPTWARTFHEYHLYDPAVQPAWIDPVRVEVA